MRLIADNRKARFDFSVEDVLEAGLVLQGSEVKSVRLGRVNLRDAHVMVEQDEAFVYGMHIAPYEQSGQFNHEPYRKRKLLLHRRQIDALSGRVRERGMTLVPLRLYVTDRGHIKIEVGLCRGKKLFDKRSAIAERDARRDVERALRSRS